MAGSTRKRRPKGASKLSSADDDGLTDDDLADERDAPESSAAGDGSSTDTVVVSEGEAPAARKARLEAEISRTRARLDALVAAVETIELEQLPAGRRSGGRLATVDAAEEVSLTLDKVPPAAGASDAGVPFWRTRLWWAKFWVVATGIWWGVCMQLLYYEGASSPASALPNVDWYLGMMLVYLPQLCRQYGGGAADERFGKVRQRDMVPIALFDLLGTVGTTVGLELAGSAIFGIILGSITVWTALFTWLLMGQRQSAARLVGICVVVAGLGLPMMEYRHSDGAGTEDIAWGIALTFGGTFFYALEYSLCERVYTLYEKPLDARQLCFFTGAWGMLATSVWIGGYTGPRWEELVASDVEESGGRLWVILLLYASHTLNNAVHNLAWFYVCELEGGVTTGLLQGVKAALLFVASAACFCTPQHPEQCYSAPKLGATTAVLVGTVIYYAACPARCAQGLAASGGGGEGGGRKATVDVAEPVEPAAADGPNG